MNRNYLTWKSEPIDLILISISIVFLGAIQSFAYLLLVGYMVCYWTIQTWPETALKFMPSWRNK